MINASGRELTGKITIQKYEMAFVNNSLHSGTDNYPEGERIAVFVKDPWSLDVFEINSLVPRIPQSGSSNILLVVIGKDLTLSTKWKIDKTSLEDKRRELLLSNFQCLPIVLYNEGRRADFVARLVQRPYVYVCDRLQFAESIHFINYGFLHVAPGASDCKVALSYGAGQFTETNVATIPLELVRQNPNATALYLHVDQVKHRAKLYCLENTESDPRQISSDILSDRIQLPDTFRAIQMQRTTTHVEIHGFCIPDLNALEESESSGLK